MAQAGLAGPDFFLTRHGCMHCCDIVFIQAMQVWLYQCRDNTTLLITYADVFELLKTYLNIYFLSFEKNNLNNQ